MYAVDFLDLNNGYVVGSICNGENPPNTTYTSIILKTTNGGNTWNIIKTFLNTSHFTDIDFISTSTGWATSYGYIYKTIDGGINWTTCDPGYAYSSEIVFVNDNIGFVICQIGTILKSTDGGSSWVATSIGAADMGALFFTDNITGYVTTINGHVWKTTNAGSTWEHVSEVDNKSLYDIFFIDSNIGYMAGDGWKIYKSSDGGLTWNIQNSGVSSKLVGIFFTDNTHGWAVGEDGTILHTDNGGVGLTENESEKNKFIIYPNSSNKEITIEIIENIKPMGNECEIINIDGQIIRNIKLMKTKTQLDISNIPSGIYFIKLLTDKSVEVKKFIKE